MKLRHTYRHQRGFSAWTVIGSLLIITGVAGLGFALIEPGSKTPVIRLPAFFSTAADRATIYAMREHGKWGFIDRTGKIVIPAQFDAVRNQQYGDGVTTEYPLAVRNGNLWGFIDKLGHFVIEPTFDDVAPCYVHQLFDDPAACNFFRYGSTPVRSGGKWGYIDASGQFLIQPQFDEARTFTPIGISIVKNDHRLGFIDKTGAYIVPARFLSADIDESGALNARDELHQGFIDRMGHFYVDYHTLGLRATRPPWSEGLLAVQRQEGHWGYIDEKAQMVIPATFQDALPFRESRAAVKLNNKWGYINHTGQFEIQPKFDHVDSFRNGRATAMIGARQWIASSRPEYRGQLFGRGGKVGVIDASGTFVVKPQFDQIMGFVNGLAAVSINGKWGYVDQHGNTAIPLEYDAAESFFGELARVERAGLMQRIDKTNRVVWRETAAASSPDSPAIEPPSAISRDDLSNDAASPRRSIGPSQGSIEEDVKF